MNNSLWQEQECHIFTFLECTPSLLLPWEKWLHLLTCPENPGKNQAVSGLLSRTSEPRLQPNAYRKSCSQSVGSCTDPRRPTEVRMLLKDQGTCSPCLWLHQDVKGLPGPWPSATADCNLVLERFSDGLPINYAFPHSTPCRLASHVRDISYLVRLWAGVPHCSWERDKRWGTAGL